MANQRCIPGELPGQSQLPIPKNISWLVISEVIETPAFAKCCSPNPVQLADNCYRWCEIPPTLQNGSTNSIDSIKNRYGFCLATNGGTQAIFGVYVNAAGGIKPGMVSLFYTFLIVYSVFIHLV